MAKGWIRWKTGGVRVSVKRVGELRIWGGNRVTRLFVEGVENGTGLYVFALQKIT